MISKHLKYDIKSNEKEFHLRYAQKWIILVVNPLKSPSAGGSTPRLPFRIVD